MPFTGIAHPEQLAVLTNALQSYCKQAQIEPNTPAYFDAAKLSLILFESGIADSDELATALRNGARTPKKA